jgi:small subunit ribosomal protein S4|uniref:Ribosomal protein S4 n=1 Tax=Baffinella frigidus TaxID=2571260 RepID=A0A6C0X716_9CRYP|nr:ribosomal protein S4 [Cryptophyta sp. CCMP2293]
MTKRKNSKFSVCKKIPLNYKNLWGAKKDKIKAVKVISRKIIRFSMYNLLIKFKQCLKNFYTNIHEQKFKGMFKLCMRSWAKTLDKFISFSESRLDVILYRVGFVLSLHQARQFINHGHLLVNDIRVYLPSTKIYRNYLISFSKNNIVFKRAMFLNIYSRLCYRSTLSHLEVNYKLLNIIFLWDPDFKNTFFPINTKYSLIPRFYK